MRKLAAILLGASALHACADPAFAGQVPAPINAPSSAGAGDLYGASGTNPRQAVDTGLSATNAGQDKVVAGPCSGGSGALSERALCAADLPLATTSAAGGVEVGTGLSVSAGVVSVTNPSPGTSVSGDVLTFSGTTGQLHDSGTLLSALLTSATAASSYLPLTGGTITGSDATLLTIGNGGSAGSATPTELAFDATYGTTAGVDCKISLYGSGCAVGLGVSAGDQLNLMASATALWGASGTEEMSLTSIGITVYQPITYSGALPTGTASTYACWTSAGKLISSSGAC